MPNPNMAMKIDLNFEKLEFSLSSARDIRVERVNRVHNCEVTGLLL